MANNFKFDIGSTVRQVEDLNKSLQGLGQVAQTLFANLGQLSEAFGNKMSNLSQGGASGITPSAMLTPMGHSNAEAALQDEVRRMRIKKELEAGSDRFVVAPSGQIQERTVTGGQTRVAFTGYTKESLYRNTNAEQAFTNATATNTPAAGSLLPQQAVSSSVPFGYGIKDIPRLVGAQKDVAGLGDSLGKAITEVSVSNKGIAEILKAIKSSLESSNNDFTAALEELSQKAHLDKSSPVYQEAQARAISAAAAFEKAKENADEISRMYGGGGGGGGGAGGADDPQRKKLLGLQNMVSRGAALVGAGVALYGTYESTSLAFENAIYGKELAYKEERGRGASRVYQQALEAHDMTKAENILKYRADLLLPGRKFEALGAEGGANTMRMATEMIKDMRDIQRRERNLSMVGAGGQLIQGGLQFGAGLAGMYAGGTLGTALFPGIGTVAGAALGGLLGAGIAGDNLSKGIATIGGVLRGTPQAAIGNQYTAYSGGLTGGLGGAAGGLLVGGRYGKLAQYAQLAERQKDVTMALDVLERGRQAELQENQPTLMALNESLQSMGAMRDSALLVGRYATGPDYYRKIRQDAYAPSSDIARVAKEKRDDIEARRAAAVPIALLEGNLYTRSDAELRAEAKRVGGGDPKIEAMALDQLKSSSRVVRNFDQQYNNKIQEQVVPLEQASKTLASSVKLPWTDFGMSEAEFIRAQGMASGVISRGRGLGADEDQTAKLLGFKYGGFGSMEQLTGNLIGLNKAGGGQDNLQRLERILTVAVSEGFDRSRMTQAFVNSTNELSRTLNVTSPENMARTLGALTGFTGVIGKPDERQLERASKGIADYAAFSGQTGGTIGALKLQAAYGAGIGIGGGASLLTKMNAEEAANALKELDEFEKKGTPISSERLRAIINLQGGDSKKVRAGLTGQLTGGSQLQFRATYNMMAARVGREGFDSAVTSLGKATSKQERTKILEKIQAGAMETAEYIGISEVGAIAGMAGMIDQEFRSRGEKNPMAARESAKYFEEARKAALAKSVDPAEVKLRKFIDMQVSDFGRKTSFEGVGADRFFQLQKEYGISLTTASGREVTKEQYEKARSATGEKKKEGDQYILEANEAIAKADTLVLAREASAKASYAAGEQSVRIANVAELSMALAFMIRKEKENHGK